LNRRGISIASDLDGFQWSLLALPNPENVAVFIRAFAAITADLIRSCGDTPEHPTSSRWA
jgi:hypothetical protein